MSSPPHVLTRGARAYAALRHAASDPYVRGAYFALLALVTLWPTLGKASLLNEFFDAQYFQLYEEVARISVARFHELPLWNPYYCGGLSGLGTPSARFFSPTFLLTLVFGTFRGSILTIAAMTWLGLEGTFRFGRARGAGALAAMTAAPVFALSGVFARSSVVGWTNFFGFELLPWAVFGVGLAWRGNRRGLVVAAVAVAWMIGFGGTYTAPLTGIAIAVDLLVVVARRAGQPRRARLACEMGVLVVLLAAALSAARLGPIAETLSASPRILGSAQATSPSDVWDLLFGARTEAAWRDDFLIGVFALPLVVLGVVRKRALPTTVLGGLSLWLALGSAAPLSIFALLRTVPPYTMLRAPERFLVLFGLVAAGLSALGVRRVEAAARKNGRTLLAAIVCQGLLVGDTALLIRNHHLHATELLVSPAPPDATASDFRQSRGNRWLAAYFPFMNRGSLTCFDDYDVAQSPDLRGDLPAEEYLRDPLAGTVTRTEWSPNHIGMHVALTRPARVYVNQNWHPGWRSSTGSVVADNGLLAVDLPAGSHDVTLRFRPRSVVAGLLASVLGLGAAAVILWRARRSDGRLTARERLLTAAVCALPLGAALLVFAFLREPRRPPPPLVTPAGDPMIVDAPPPGSVPVGARWAEGITLEAAHVNLEPSRDRQSMVATVELDWRIDQELPSGLGVFVILVREGSPHVGADHVRLSGVLALDEAPLHKTLRDVAQTVSLPPGKNPSTWTVSAGLWWARRDETRLEVADPGAQPARENAVFVTSFVAP